MCVCVCAPFFLAKRSRAQTHSVTIAYAFIFMKDYHSKCGAISFICHEFDQYVTLFWFKTRGIMTLRLERICARSLVRASTISESSASTRSSFDNYPISKPLTARYMKYTETIKHLNTRGKIKSVLKSKIQTVLNHDQLILSNFVHFY